MNGCNRVREGIWVEAIRYGRSFPIKDAENIKAIPPFLTSSTARFFLDQHDPIVIDPSWFALALAKNDS